MSPNLAYKQIPNQFIETIREQSDLVSIVSEYLSLKKAGQNYTALCPFHQEKTPSFSVNPVKQFFHCFGCGVGGDVFHFLEKIEGLSFSEALQRLAERGGISLPAMENQRRRTGRSESDEIYRLNEAAAAYFHHNLLKRPEGARALSYLEGRGITIAAMKKFSIGYALPGWDHFLKAVGKRFSTSLLEKSGLVSRKSHPGISEESGGCYDRFRNRILFPIHTMQGKVAGFGGRVLDDAMPKYLNTPETSVFTKRKHLYGLNHVKRKGLNPLIIVEGYLDVVVASQSGVPNVVATLGTALTEDHLALIRRIGEKIVLIFDGDEAGIRAAIRAVPLLIDQRLSSAIVSLPPGKDPDTFLQEEGKEAFLHKVENSQSVIDFSITQMIRQFSDKSIDGKIKIIEQVAPLIERLPSPVERSHYLKSLSELLFIREKDVLAEYRRFSKKKRGHALKSNTTGQQKMESRFPEEQEMILTLLIQDCLDPEELNGKLGLKDFTNATIQGLMSHYWDDETAQWVRSSIFFEDLTDEEKKTLSRLSVAEINREQVEQRATRDYICMLRSKKLDRQKSELDKELKRVEKKGDLEAVNRLSLEIIKIIDLKRAESQFTLSQ